MFERILIPLDGSERSEVILAQLVPFFERFQPAVTLLAVVEDPGGRDDRDLADLAAARQRAQAYLRDAAERLRTLGAEATIAVGTGDPAEVILDSAHQGGYDLVAMASHGHSGLARLLYGSVTERVLRHARVPVLVMRSFGHTRPRGEPVRASREPTQWRRILVPLDGSRRAERILPLATALARTFGSELHLLRVAPVAPRHGFLVAEPAPASDTSSEQAYVERVADDVEGVPTVVPAVVQGYPVVSIERYAKKKQIDLVALCTHGRTGLQRFLLGSVAEGLIRTLDVPLLVLRASGDGADA